MTASILDVFCTIYCCPYFRHVCMYVNFCQSKTLKMKKSTFIKIKMSNYRRVILNENKI